MTQQRLDLLAAVFFFLLSIVGTMTAHQLPSGAGDFPKIAFFIFFLASVAIGLNSIRSPSDDFHPFKGILWHRLLLVVTVFLGSVLLLRTLGFPIVALFLFMVVQIIASPEKLTGRRLVGSVLIALFSVVAMTTLFLIFLRVSLPWGMLSEIRVITIN